MKPLKSKTESCTCLISNRGIKPFRNTQWRGMTNNLKDAVVSVVDQTVRTKSISDAIQAVHVAFTFIGIPMSCTWIEVAGFQHWFQPWRTHILLSPHSHNWTQLLMQIESPKKSTKKICVISETASTNKSGGTDTNHVKMETKNN